MSTAEDAVGKYVDDVVKSTPLTSIAAAIAGIYLHKQESDGASSWMQLLYQKMSIGWEFLPALKELHVYTLFAIVMCGWCGPTISRIVLKQLLRIGSDGVTNVIERTYAKSRKLADDSAFKPEDFALALSWRKLHARSLSRSLTVSNLAFSMCLVSIVAAGQSHSLIDFAVASSFLAIGCVATWRASLQFIKSYLPERILMDASLGLSKVDMKGSIDDAFSSPRE